MPEFRKDPVSRRWVVFSSERRKRPRDFITVEENDDNLECPFCEGNEHLTPPEIFALREEGGIKDGPGWRVRLIPDKFSILEKHGDLTKKGHGIYDSMSSTGRHELIIETPSHMGSFLNLSYEEIETVLKVVKKRIKEIKTDYRIQYVLVVKNYGSEAGAKFKHSHSHSHIVGLPILPKRVKEEINGAKEYYKFRERCIFCDIIFEEMSSKERIVCSSDNFVSICSYAGRFPYETHIYPKKHIACFEDTDDSMFKDLSITLKDTIKALSGVIDSAAYNLVIHTAPVNQVMPVLYHWHIELIPRTNKVAGFEWGSGFYINSVLPEEAAHNMRKILGR